VAEAVWPSKKVISPISSLSLICEIVTPSSFVLGLEVEAGKVVVDVPAVTARIRTPPELEESDGLSSSFAAFSARSPYALS
jgi:hypothetical protein